MIEQNNQEAVRSEMSRRGFLKAGTAAVGTVVLGGIAGCGDNVTKVVKTADTTTTTPSGYSFETAPAPITNIVKTVSVDVVVVGGGVAGCSAACSAAEKGLSVILLEKTKSINGRGFGAGSADSKTLKSLGVTVDKESAQKLWIKTCCSRVNEKLVSLFFNRSGEAMDWVIDKITAAGGTSSIWSGYDRDPMFTDQPAYHIFANADWSLYGGLFMATVLRDDAIKAGASFIYSSPAAQLVKEGGRVVAVIAKDADGYKRYNASKGVVLATGDMAGDPEMVKAWCPLVNDAVASLYTPAGANTGDGHKMGLWVGGAVQTPPFPPMLHPQVYAYYHAAFLFVNTNGERFMNEATWVQGKSLNIMRQPNHYAWAIFDKNWLTQLLNGLPKGGGMFWDQFRLWGQDFDQAAAQKAVAGAVADGATGFQADSIAALAAKINVDATTLAATVARYNVMVNAGADTDFYKNQLFLGPVTDGPFYAMKIGPGVLTVVGGLRIDSNMNVLNTSGSPIAGLYAAGNVSGDLYAVDYPINIPGNSHTRALLWGYIAGESLKK